MGCRLFYHFAQRVQQGDDSVGSYLASPLSVLLLRMGGFGSTNADSCGPLAAAIAAFFAGHTNATAGRPSCLQLAHLEMVCWSPRGSHLCLSVQ